MYSLPARRALASAIAALLPLSAFALEAAPGQDTYVTSASPTTDFSTLPTLNVASNSRALVKFDLATLPPGVGVDQIGRATLRLWVNKVTTAGTVEITPATAPWAEGTTTHANAPLPVGAPVASMAIGTAGRYVYADVTELVKDWIDGSLANHGIV